MLIVADVGGIALFCSCDGQRGRVAADATILKEMRLCIGLEILDRFRESQVTALRHGRLAKPTRNAQ